MHAALVLSSFVVRGSVGGRAALSGLEALGVPVWLVPTVLLPWHPGLGPGRRIVAADADFSALLDDLSSSARLNEVGGVLTGYFADPAQVEAAAGLIAAVHHSNPGAVVVCDPVIGDKDGLYVPEAIAAAIRDKLVPLADVLTPNRHELAWLAGRSLSDNAALFAAARRLGPKAVVVTSAYSGWARIANLLAEPDSVLVQEHERLEVVPNGTGDLLAALLLGYRLNGADLRTAFRQAVAATAEAARTAVAAGADALPLADLRRIVAPRPTPPAASAG